MFTQLYFGNRQTDRLGLTSNIGIPEYYLVQTLLIVKKKKKIEQKQNNMLTNATFSR